MNLLLEMYCLFQYKSSQNLKDAIWNNWLVNVTGELGRWIPDDLLQEHYNRWLEEMVKKSGKNFDDKFLRKVISPNVEFFLRLKEELEASFELYKRSKSHTSCHLCAEFQQLLTFNGEENIHVFQSTHSLGHAAVPLLNHGSQKLADGTLSTHCEHHTNRVAVLQSVEDKQNAVENGISNSIPSSSTSDVFHSLPPVRIDPSISDLS